MNEYIANAKNFLKSCNAKMSITFKRYGKHFEDDKDFRNIYTVRIDRDGKSFSFQFGDSVMNTVNHKRPTCYDVLACLQKYDMSKQMRDLTIKAIDEICSTAEFCNKNFNKSGYEHLPYYGEFQYWSASLMIIVETDGSKTIFLDIDAYFEHDDLHKSFRLENLPEELIDTYCGHAFMATVQSFGGNFSRCKFNGNQRSF